jgi:hypothetical protein
MSFAMAILLQHLSQVRLPIEKVALRGVSVDDDRVDRGEQTSTGATKMWGQSGLDSLRYVYSSGGRASFL